MEYLSFSQTSKSQRGSQDHEFGRQQSVIKEGWSRLTALHTVLLADKMKNISSAIYHPPMVEILSRRWQDRCQEVSIEVVDGEHQQQLVLY